MTTPNETVETFKHHQWAPPTEWLKMDIDSEEAIKKCRRCDLEVLMRRKLEFDGHAPPDLMAYRKSGEAWCKMYHTHGHRALPQCEPIKQEHHE